MIEKLSYLFDIDRLVSECNDLILSIGLHNNQLSLKHPESCEENCWHIGTGSFKIEKSLAKLLQKDFTILNSELNDTYIKEVYEKITSDYSVGRFRIMCLPGQKCMTLHHDMTQRIHIPLVTNEDCLMIIQDQVFHMPADGSAYLTDTYKRHTALNANWDFVRSHLVFDLI
jgi:hypothetical protein